MQESLLNPDEPMSRHTTLGIGGPAKWYAEPKSLAELKKILHFSEEKNLPLFFLGAGSNLLVSDTGIHAVVVRLRGTFEQFQFSGNEVRTGAGVMLPTLVKSCAEKGLAGAEPLIGVPGTVGGALVMNAGTRELEIGKITKSVEILDKEKNLQTIPAEKIRFEYRSSSLLGAILCFATLQLKPGKKGAIIQTIEKFLLTRRETQPIGTKNVGSIFKNPEGAFAAELIEKAGFKGKKLGNAQVSPKHANFIVNLGGAKANEVKGLIQEIQKAVKEKFGVGLEPEIKFVGYE